MLIITLPDSSQRSYPSPVSIYDVAADIGPGLASDALAGKIDGILLDLSHIIEFDAELSIVTSKSEEGLGIIRHSTAHLMAQAVKILFPEAQVTIGPVVDNGFYYDFSYERPFTPQDLDAIERKMSSLVLENAIVVRRELGRDEAISYFLSLGEKFKAEIIEDIPSDQTLSLYRQNEFEDLCRGPHVPSLGKLKHFKLMKVAGAYWRGDAKNQMLQRIYGTAWRSKKELQSYLFQLEEAEKRDHRKLAKKFNLFHLQEEAPGMIFWHPKGWSIYTVIESYMRDIQRLNGYQEIRTPLIVARSLWEKSGHWDKFRENMFTVQSEADDFAVKPMNCPCHVQVFNQGLKSYRDLPLRLAEFGSCHRDEASGTLQGLMRVRGFVQDDAHIFCTESQILDEVATFTDLLFLVYRDFGFDDIVIRLSTRPESRVGSDEVWDKAEDALMSALSSKNLDYDLLPGEGAFYGPKIEFSLKDCLGRVWQCGTIQVDFSMPERLDAQYVSEDGSRKVPVMLHRAILGSFERFIGVLIEHYEGNFPVWLAPCQAIVMNITDSQAKYVIDVVDSLKNKGFRVENDLRNEKIGFKIREHTIQRIPYLLVVGDKEVESQAVTVRSSSGKDLGTMQIPDFIILLERSISFRGRMNFEN
jgi:threonyl-tRNA synthetase|tara:strand:+ start:2528 stop:4453 length:1926 start_codon:yes stop_codon:yes gene_type:complete